MPESDCDEFRRVLTAVLDGSGTLEAAKGRMLHLIACEDCGDWFCAQEIADPSNADLQGKQSAFAELFYELARDAPPEPPSEMEIAMRDTRDASDRDVDATVERFLAKHPSLAPEAFGIDMTKFTHATFFCAVDAVNMLLCRIGDAAPGATYSLNEDGAVFLEGEPAVKAEAVRREIGRFIAGTRIVPEEEKVEDLVEAIQLDAAWRDDETCAKLAKWIVAAVSLKSDLLRNFHLIDTFVGRLIVLERVKRGTSPPTALDLWKE